MEVTKKELTQNNTETNEEHRNEINQATQLNPCNIEGEERNNNRDTNRINPLRRNNGSQNDNSLWNYPWGKLWQLDITPKIKHIIWKTWNEALPITDNLL